MTVADSSLHQLLRERFGHERFRPFQEEVCQQVVAGEDLLLVMPTGAGKSLCYQLPGLAREGTTLVISPLIALMEDQVAGLQKLGLAAERIHSGRPRANSQAVCKQYLAGELDFLFVAPERLGVPGFVELLARGTLGLIAVDEAHCISQWGHDFRPDYRQLKLRLPALRPAPVLALTATATPLVQRDISEQLGIPNAGRYIFGFRRDNLAIEVVDRKPSERLPIVERLLSQKERVPAIVYAPTRKKAEQVSEALANALPVAAYHAGMSAEERDRVQSGFLNGELDAIVATIAFGMGIDKSNVRTVIHLSLPASVEGYYQEIGRAGRDGDLSRAILLHSFGDRRQHEWFLERDYPKPDELDRIFRQLTDRPQSADQLFASSGLEPENFSRALTKLTIHGGAVAEEMDQFALGSPQWSTGYTVQRQRRYELIAEMLRYADTSSCRMLHLVRHFGDQRDSGERCGYCDVCDPAAAVAVSFRAPNDDETKAIDRILAAVKRRNGGTSGQIHREEFGNSLPRNEFQSLVAALVRTGWLREAEDAFEKEGRVIEFKRLHLTAAGSDADDIACVRIELRAPSPPSKRSRAHALSVDAKTAEAQADPVLVKKLKSWRTAEAKQRSVPPYCILQDKVLLNIAHAKPADLKQLANIKGMGPVRIEQYGAALIKLICD